MVFLFYSYLVVIDFDRIQILLSQFIYLKLWKSNPKYIKFSL